MNTERFLTNLQTAIRNTTRIYPSPPVQTQSHQPIVIRQESTENTAADLPPSLRCVWFLERFGHSFYYCRGPPRPPVCGPPTKEAHQAGTACERTTTISNAANSSEEHSISSLLLVLLPFLHVAAAAMVS